MHEFAIAQQLIEIAQKSAKEAQALVIEQVVVDVGSLSGVDKEALETAMQMVAATNGLELARLILQTVDPLAECHLCATRFCPEENFSPCPSCGEFFWHLLKGGEIILKSIDIR